MIKERFLLVRERIKEIENNENNEIIKEPYKTYFQKVAAFLTLMSATYDFVEGGSIYQVPLEELQSRNHTLYEDILPEHYEGSFANPRFAVSTFGEEYGRLMAFLYTELRSLIVFAHELRLERMVIGMELFLEVYSSFVCAAETEDGSISDRLPAYEEIRQILYWFVYDYAELAANEKVKALVDPNNDFALKIIMNHNLSDIRYLYYYGEYVTENEIAQALHLMAQSEDVIKLMADTYTEGYRKGFEITNKDIGKKKTVNIRYCLGFERMIRQSVLNFEQMGLRPTIYRASASVMEGKSVSRVGYYGAIPNKQYDYDHKDDQALVLDKQWMVRRLEAARAAYEKYKAEAIVFGGPAVVGVFGETPASPEFKAEALHLSEKQQQLAIEYASAAGAIQNEFIPGEERSFTIIAFPTPEIGADFGTIFNETIKINTLDYILYRNIQQTIIDTLDQAEYVLVKGMGKNKTNLKIQLRELKDPEKETNFENCVADVNIPVGEVFTSPRLEGTEGVLHVTKVFLGELEYIDLMLTVKDGMVESYGCANFDKEEENRKYIKDNILNHHASLPMGEFAIGTNTTAYMVGKKYDIAHKFPILIAEKTGPHFAFGDTCYSHAEEVKVYNPDGKEIIARDNEVSILRVSDVGKAYYNCHTDITIPYDELGEVSAITRERQVIPIIEEGRFVLEGCSELNKPFD